WPLYAAVDYGFTNYWVWLWIQVDPNNRVYVLGEHYWKERDTQDIAERELKHHPWLSKLVAFYPDPHNPDDTQILQRVLRKPARSNTGGEIRTRNAMVRRLLKPTPEGAPASEQTAQLVVDINR